jgi:NCS2 family nucleobase:cation symporter-2
LAKKNESSDKTLKRLLRRKSLLRLTTEIARRKDSGLAVSDSGGELILGEAADAIGDGAEIRCEGRPIGRVYGADAGIIAEILSVSAEQYAENRALATDTLGKYKEISMLYDVSERILSLPDPQQVAALVCEEATRFLKGNSYSVLVLNEETGRLELIASNGQAYHSRSSVEVSDDLIGAVLRSGTGEIVNDLHSNNRSIAADNSLRSVVCSPLKTRNRIFGVVVVGSDSSRHYNASDLQLLNALSSQAAAAIEVVRLHSALRMSSSKPADLIYAVDERPPVAVQSVLGLQHVCIALMSLAYPVLVTLEAGGSRLEAASVVSMSLIAMAVATLLQGVRWGPVGSGFLAPHITSAVFLAPSLIAARTGGLGLVFGMTLFSGVLGLLFSQVIGRFRKLFPPEVCGVVVLMVGLSMIKVAMPRFLGLDELDTVSEPAEWVVGLITIGTIVTATVMSLGRIRLYSTIIGIVVGYLAALMLGVLDISAFGRLHDLPLVDLPTPPTFELTFSLALAVPFLAAVLASSIKGVGLITTSQKANDSQWKRPDTKSISGGIVAESLGNLMAGTLGGVGTGIGAGSVGLTVATGATSRVIAVVVAAMFVTLSLMPKVTAALALMPSPVMGAGLIYVACFLVTSGVQLIVSRLLDTRRTFIVGLSVLAGVGVDVMPDVFQGAPEWAAAFLTSPLALSTTLAVGLNVALSFGVSNRADLNITVDGRAQDAIIRFFERHGASWGARPDVIRRAAPAAVDWYEEIGQILGDTKVDGNIALQFDEFHLNVHLSWTAVGSTRQEDREIHSRDLDPIAGHIQRRYGCRLRLTGDIENGQAQLDFEH